jgi:hypothetical protein
MPDNFNVCRLPLGAYQFATFIHQTDEEAYDPYWKPPIYTVEFESALRVPFVIERCKMLIDPHNANKLVAVLQAISVGSPDTLVTMEEMMRTEEYGVLK